MLGYQGKNQVGNLREFGLILISKDVRVLGQYVLFTQKCQNEMWHKKWQRKIVLISKRLSGFCLCIANKT